MSQNDSTLWARAQSNFSYWNTKQWSSLCRQAVCAPGDSERQISKQSQGDSHVTVLCLHVSGLPTSDWHLSVTLSIFLSKGSWGRTGQADRTHMGEFSKQDMENSSMPGESIRGQWGRHLIHLKEPNYWIWSTCECFTHIFFFRVLTNKLYF